MVKAAVLGLGAMGAPMALNLDRAGQLAAVWNRSPERATALSLGAEVLRATTAGAAAAAADVIILSLSRDTDVLEVVAQIRPYLNRQSVVVDTSTVSAATARRIAEELADDDISFLDAPVSGGVEGAVHARLAMMVGGKEAALERCLPLLRSIAANVVHMGESGAGQATKAVNQIMAAGINQAVTEALAFGAAQGLDMRRVLDVVRRGAAGNWFLDHRGASMLEGRYETGFKLSLHHKDLAICLSMAAERGGPPLPLTEMTLEAYEELMAEGYGGEDISALYRLKRP
ncbi:MAG TPA: oxidoreductase [Gammaproteobacteria bacterium]|nr:oxidoreductase [Gammaproteobacteria bacterium]